jgi:hypothetical protein
MGFGLLGLLVLGVSLGGKKASSSSPRASLSSPSRIDENQPAQAPSREIPFPAAQLNIGRESSPVVAERLPKAISTPSSRPAQPAAAASFPDTSSIPAPVANSSSSTLSAAPVVIPVSSSTETATNASAVLSPQSTALSSGSAEALDTAPVWELPPGVKAPAAFYENGTGGNPSSVLANEQIAQSFEEEVTGASTTPEEGTTETSVEVWDTARKRADESYRAFFGDAAYNQRGLQATGDALSSVASSAED